MAYFETVAVPPNPAGDTRDERSGGTYRRYHPDMLMETKQWVDPETMEYVADVTAKVAALASRVKSSEMDYLYALLMKSESIASSRIEGHVASAKQVAVAELSGEGSRDVLTVAHNVAAMRAATTNLVRQPVLDDEAVHVLHQTLLPELHRGAPGYRIVQNWISGRSLLRAKFVPPPWEEVRTGMADLLRYCNEGAETAIVKAAVVHAQFETIHPYIDGNGRTGRGLTHTVLIRSGLIPGPILPFSAALATNRDDYIAGLTAYRYAGPDRQDGLSLWVRMFADAISVGVDAAETLLARSNEILGEWTTLTADARSDAAIRRLPPLLIRQPVVTIQSVAESLSISEVAASSGLQRAAELGIARLTQSKVSRQRVYAADQILDLITLTERGLASTDWDTKSAAPVRPVPPLPDAQARRPKAPCDHVLARSGKPCRLPSGHHGQHRPVRGDAPSA